MKKSTFLVWFVAFLTILFSFNNRAFSQSVIKQGTIVRDTQIEDILKSYIKPLWRAAGLPLDYIKIYMIADPRINAAALQGGVVLINTGAILECKNVGELIGVLAHETAHIAGGHHARLYGAQQEASKHLFASVALGAIGALVTGDPAAFAAIAMGGQHIAERSFLHYHRGEEASADQGGARYLEKLGWSAKGLYDFLKSLEKEDFLPDTSNVAYVRTHPLSKDRLSFLKNHLEKSKWTQKPFDPAFERSFALIKYKIKAYLYPEQTLLMLDTKDDFTKRYVEAIVAFRKAEFQKAVTLSQNLINDFPNDPYLHELKGQILYEHGRIQESIAPLLRANELRPNASLLQMLLAQALLENNASNEAIALLSRAAFHENSDPWLWRLLATAYGKKNDLGNASLALAEQFVLENKPSDAKMQATRAIKLLPQNSSAYMRAQDILSQVILLEQKQKGPRHETDN